MRLELPGRLRRAAEAFVEVASSIDPVDPVPMTPEWTTADLVAHVAIEARRYRRELEGDSDWSASGGDIAETNRRALAAEPDRDVPAALERMQRDVGRYADLLAARDLDEPSHHLDGGLVLAPRHAAGLLLGELVLHRRDLAQVDGGDLSIDREDALVVATGAVHTIPGMIDTAAAAGRRAAIELRLRGGATHGITLLDGTASVTPGRLARRDAVLSVDPVGFLLLSYGRRGQLATIVRGHVVVWGRRLHRALLLDRVVHRP
jgi:hypothetical protein